MATMKSTELSATELELKRRGRRRLIGAATIGLLGIVFLPMFFDGEPKRNLAGPALSKQEISVQVPPKDGLPPLPAPSVATPPSTPAPQPPVAVDIATEASASKASPVAVQPKPEKSAPAANSRSAVADKNGFAIQLGAFRDAENANKAIAKMKHAKLPVYTDSISNKGITETRVRVGPFATREKADSALAEIKLAGSDGKIVPLQ